MESQSGIQERSTDAYIIAGAMQETGRGKSIALLDFEEVTAQIYKSTFHALHTFRTWFISDSVRVTHWNGDVVKGRQGYGRAGPPPEGERPFTATNKPACFSRDLDGAPRRALPHSIPLGHTFHDDMAPCRMGPGILRRSGRPYLSCSIDIVPVRAGAISWLQC